MSTNLAGIRSNPIMVSGTGDLVIDCAGWTIIHAHAKAVGGNAVVKLTNSASTQFLFLMTEQDEVGGRSITFDPVGVILANPAPTQTLTPGGMDCWIFGHMMATWHQHAFSADVR